MPQDSFRDRTVTYVEPRLGLSVLGRLLVRVVSSATLVLLAALVLLGLLSDVPLLRGCGLFALLLLGERLWYRDTGERRLTTLARLTNPNLALACTPRAYAILERAYDAMRIGREPLEVALLAQLLRDPHVLRVLARTEADTDVLAHPEFEPLAVAYAPDAVTAVFSVLLASAADTARGLSQPYITPAMLLVGLLDSGDETIARTASRAQLTRDDLLYALQATYRYRTVPVAPRVVPHHIMNRAWTSRPTPHLDAVAYDLTDIARLGLLAPLQGHGEAYELLVTTLAKPTHPHALLVAPAGGGKETVVGEVARAIVAGTAPTVLSDRRLVRIDVAALLAAGGSDPAALIKAVADDILIAGNVVLYIPDFEHLAQATGAYVAAADVLLPLLTADTFPVIAATTPEAYARVLETRGDVAGSFQTIRLSTLSVADTVAVLSQQVPTLERMYRVTFSIAALRTAAQLASQYLAPARPVPGSALDVLAETAQVVRGTKVTRVRAQDIEQTLERMTHVPMTSTTARDADTLLQLDALLQTRVVGQDEAVHAVAEGVRAYRAGLLVGDTPLSFLFVGPTGVGKTELAKALAETTYGADAFVRLDMSEFSGPDSVARLLGDTTHGGALTEPVRISPHRLILLDELEKASPEAVRLLLQVTSDGRLTDGLGRTVSYKDALIVATSNAQSGIIRDALRQGEHVTAIEGYVRERLQEVFPQELLNRFTRIAIFRDLSPDHLRTIAAATITDIARLVDEKYGVILRADDGALTELVRRGYDPQWGARPLRRAVESVLDGVLAPRLLARDLPRGATVTLTYKDTTFSLVN